MKPLRVGVIGAGAWGRNHVRTFAGMPEVELVAVCDVNPERCAQIERAYPGVHVTAESDDLLSRVDAVVIAAPARSHAPLGHQAVAAGVPALIEKPFALSVADAERLADTAAKAGVPILAGHLLEYHPAVERLRQMIVDATLGDLYYLYSTRVNLGQVRPDENALWSFGPHDVSVTMHLLGDVPTRVAAQGRSFLQPDVEDIVFFTMEFASGVLAQIQMSWLDPHKERSLTVVGSRKMVVFDDMQVREKLKVFDKGIDRPPDYGSYGESLAVREGDIWIPRVSNAEPLRAELSHFARVVRREESPTVTAADGLNVVRVLTAATESLRDGGRAIDFEPLKAGSS